MRKILFTCFCFAVILAAYSQNDNTTIKAGALTLEPNIPKNPVAGTICWTGTEFLGFNGAQWIPLNGTESDASTIPIKIWSYLFQFPREFSLVPGTENDTDSYIGTIEGTGISLDFEHIFLDGLFDSGAMSPFDIITTNEIDGHNITIIQTADLNDLTKIIINNSTDNSRLTISVNNITRAQQEMIINVFNTVEIVEPSVPIKIGRYQFQFPVGFSLVPGNGIDSYIGNINGAGISLSFDSGAYTSPSPLSPGVTEDVIQGNFRQIVKPVDSQSYFTKLFMYNINSKLDDPYFYNRLTLRVKNITPAEQEMIIDIFNAVEILY